jgi:hypothetical protein
MPYRFKKDKEKWDEGWLQTKEGFFSSLCSTMKKRCSPRYMKKQSPNRKIQVNNGIKSKAHLLELWEKQKKLLGGPYCIYTGVKLTMVRSRGKGFNGFTKTNISIDRIDPNLPYQEDNIVFCSWEFNNIKGAVSPEDCKKILKVYEEHRARN